ncbi:MAG: hypothetical protein FVQ81_04590, partial [Candidatus Glassbacteria bacterium]|nr:hypothetical protein [Candidatus Glassbacteria bacterium]
MNFWPVSYNYLALPLIRAVLHLASPFVAKLSQGLKGRRTSFPAIESFIADHPGGQAAGGILFHATSVGEYLQAAPLMQEIKRVDSSVPLYLSFFSPSVEKRATGCCHADLAFYLPEDTRTNMRRMIGLLAPRLIVVSKFDIWPNLVWVAAGEGVPVAVTAGTLSPDSGRVRGAAASFHRSFY